MTREQLRQAYERYKQSDWYSVTDAYKKPSCDKVAAERRIIARMKELGGKDYRVVINNTYNFTAGFVTDDRFYYITHCNTYSLLW